MKKLAIIIPVYNVERELRECLDNIKELYDQIDCEIIVVNDGSTDSSAQIIDDYTDILCLKVINQQNKGLSAARNAGLKNTDSEYVYFLDSDDFLNPRNFVEVFNLGYSRNADIIIGDYYLYFSRDNYYIRPKSRILISEPTLYDNTYAPLYSMAHHGVWRGIYRRQNIINHNLRFHEGVLFEDLEWMPQMLYCSKSILYVPTPFYFYRQREGSIMRSSFSIRQIQDAIIVGNVLSAFIETIKEKEVQMRLRYDIFHLLFTCILRCEPEISSKTHSDIKRLMKQLTPLYKYNFIRFLYLLVPRFTVGVARRFLN